MITTFVTTRISRIVALSLAVGVAPVAVAAQAERGKEVYAAQKCQVCHAIGGVGNKQLPLDGVGKKLTADVIKQWIVSPVEAAKAANSSKKPPMPAKYGALPAADIDALVAYMQSLK
jgi:mono/diheme cytochrome c family protein